MAAFDRLPPELRRALADSPHPVKADKAAALLRSFDGNAGLVRQVLTAQAEARRA